MKKIFYIVGVRVRSMYFCPTECDMLCTNK